MPLSFARMATVLGLRAAVGPFAIGMCLPAMPTIAADLKASTAATQMTLTVFMPGSVGLRPLPPISICRSPFRVVQSIGASSVMVIPRAIIRDLHTGVEADRLMSLVMLVFSVSPIREQVADLGGVAGAFSRTNDLSGPDRFWRCRKHRPNSKTPPLLRAAFRVFGQANRAI